MDEVKCDSRATTVPGRHRAEGPPDKGLSVRRDAIYSPAPYLRPRPRHRAIRGELAARRSVPVEVSGDESWRLPLGALRLTLADESAPPWQLERARAECEELVKVLNDSPPGPVVGATQEERDALDDVIQSVPVLTADTQIISPANVRNAVLAWLAARRPAPVEVSADEWREAIHAERVRQVGKGYTVEHDQRSGPNHLIDWAIDYARRGKTVAVGAMLLALRELLAVEVVSTVEELDALPLGTVLLSGGRSFERGMDLWGSPAFYSCGSAWPYKAAELLHARVLLRPDREEPGDA